MLFSNYLKIFLMFHVKHRVFVKRMFHVKHSDIDKPDGIYCNVEYCIKGDPK